MFRKDAQGTSAAEYSELLLAVYENNLEQVNTVLKRDCVDLNEIAEDGNTPLYLAARMGHTGIVERLLAHKDLKIIRESCEGATCLI